MSAKLSDLMPSLMDKEKDSSINFRDIINKYLYHWPLFIIGIAITMTAAFFYLQISSPVYEIKASIIIQDEKKDPDEKQKLQELDLLKSTKLVENEIEVLKSRNLILQVVNNLTLWVDYKQKNGLKTEDLYGVSPVKFKLIEPHGIIGDHKLTIKIKDNNSYFLEKSNGELKEISFNSNLENSFGVWKLEPQTNIKEFIGNEIKITITDPNKVAEDYQKLIDASLLNKLAPVVGLSVKDKVQERGKDVLNDLITTYNDITNAEKNRVTQSTLDFIKDRLESLATEVSSSEKNVEQFRSSRGLTDISSQAQIYLQNVQANDNKLNEVNVQLNIIDGIEHSLNTSQNVQTASASLANYPSLNSLIEKLSLLQLQRDKLLATTPETNPIYEPIDRQIRSARASIKENIQSIKSSLVAAKNKLQGYNSKYESSIQNIPGQERGLIDIKRQQSIKENLYTYLLQKREEMSLSYASAISNARIVDKAYVDNVKSSRKAIAYGSGLLLGLLLPVIFIGSRNKLSSRITTRMEIEDITGGPLFGELTYAKASSTLISLNKSNVVIGEEFRSIRTNLHFLKGKQDDGLVVLVTSSISNEGKSFVSSNLAHVLAISGKKTVILEMDLRKPKIANIFDLSIQKPGIYEYLTGQSPKEEIVQASNVHPNLSVISSGAFTSDPSELLGQDEIDSLIHWLKLNYNYIIIDTPPINLVTDAKILSRLNDVTLYIIRQAYTYKSLLLFIKSLIKEQQFPQMKFIFNGVKKGRYGYGHNYGNEYYKAINKDKKNFLGLSLSEFFKRF
ncbi:MAG TPA: polysaccharide biosynthesis tyrosine autokinase [Mucilaginibacter sp.]|nr:polysaccharide biosynthesis tyrosine autokinase [Mucilaginibacter sp.]